MTLFKRISASILTIITATGMMSTAAQAWGKLGHRVVAEIGQRHLSPEAMAQVTAILGVEDFAEIANFPDFSLSSPDPFWRGESAVWHYVTVPDDETYRTSEVPEGGDAITALAKYKTILKDPQASAADKKQALIFIVHLIGDIHQPMHAGNGTDRGGNKVEMVFFDELMNRHKVWDEGIVEFEELSYTELAGWLNRKITPEKVRAWYQPDPIDWAEESIAIRKAVYAEDVRFASYEYIFDHRDTVRTRLSQGGVRLAHYLNDIFG